MEEWLFTDGWAGGQGQTSSQMDWIAEMNEEWLIRDGWAGGQRQASRQMDWITEMNGKMAITDWVGWKAETSGQT